jgi:adenylate cyclase
MGAEIERKFLVIGDTWRAGATVERRLCQAYIARSAGAVVRVRIDADRGAVLTIKSSTPGLQRQEFEYDIPVADAEALVLLGDSAPIVKTRFEIPIGRHTWEVDVFEGVNAGLVIAEIELDRPDEAFDRPSWLGAEVTDDPRYYNAELAKRPFSTW